MPKILSIYLLLLGTAMAAADPRALLKSSAEAHEAGNYAEAIAQLQQLDDVLGQATPRVESLKVYAHVELKDWKNARIALTRYLQLARPGASSEAHQELLKLGPAIDRGLAAAEAKWRQEQQDAETALLKSLADRDAAERRTREAVLRREAAAVVQLEARQRAQPPAETLSAVISPAEVTDEQIASLAAEPAELLGWLEVHGANPANAPLTGRLRQKFTTTNLPEPLLLGDRILVGLARETTTRVFDTFPAEALAEAAGRPVAHDLYPAAGRWILRPLPWTLPPTARAHYLIRNKPDETALLANRRAGYLLTGTARVDGLWCASFVTLPVREARTEPGEKQPEADWIRVERPEIFNGADLHMWLNSRPRHRLVNLDWTDDAWTTLICSTAPSPSEAVRRQSPDFGFVPASSVEQLLHELHTQKPAAVAKVVIGADRCVALTEEGPARPLEWLLVDSLADPVLALLLESGRQIHLLADTEISR